MQGDEETLGWPGRRVYAGGSARGEPKVRAGAVPQAGLPRRGRHPRRAPTSFPLPRTAHRWLPVRCAARDCSTCLARTERGRSWLHGGSLMVAARGWRRRAAFMQRPPCLQGTPGNFHRGHVPRGGAVGQGCHTGHRNRTAGRRRCRALPQSHAGAVRSVRAWRESCRPREG